MTDHSLPGEGETLGPYSILRKLGAGGMGEVYLARDTGLGREIALKVLPAELRQDPDRRTRFLREARAVAALKHANVATIYEIGEAGGRDYIAFEYVEGPSLEQRLRGPRLTLAELLDLAVPLADGLAHAHERGIVHRDLKAANVVLTERGQPKLLDFGLAKLESRSAGKEKTTTLTLSGAIFGTPGAMSPEQALGRPVDERSDVFSFGSLLHEMAAGRPAFSGATVMETMDAVIHAEPEPLGRLRPDLPAELAGIVSKALRKDPGERYQHVTDLLADLRHLRRRTESGLVPPADERRRRWWPLAVAAPVLVMALWLGARFLPFERGAPAALDLAHAPVGVLGFENLSERGDPRRLGHMLMGLVTTDLAEAGGLEVVSTARILAARRELEADTGDGGFDSARAGAVAERAGVGLMLLGQVVEREPGLFLTAELVDVRRGRTLGSWSREAASEAGLFELASALGTGVRQRLEVAAPAGAADTGDLAASLTASTEAYRRFSAGEIALHELDFEEARTRFEQALALDPTFALAAYRLGMACDWLARDEEALKAYRAGLEHVERLPARWQAVLRASLARQEGDYETAWSVLVEHEELGADLADFNNALGEVYTHGERYLDPVAARRCFERALAADPTFRVALFHLMENYLAANDREAANALVERYRELAPGDPAARAAEASLRIAEGRIEEALALTRELEETSMYTFASTARLLAGDAAGARAVAERATARHRGFLGREATIDVYLALLAGGQLDELRRRMLEEARGLTPAGDDFGVTERLSRAEVRWAMGCAEDSVAEMREAVAANPHSGHGYFWLGFLLCELGRPDEAATVLDALDARMGEIVSPLATFWRPLLACAVAEASGELDAARAALAAAGRAAVEYRDQGLQCLFRARLAREAGDPAAAIAAYREILAPPYLRYPSAGTRNIAWRPLLITVLSDLAALEEQAGEARAAREHTQAFLAYWGAADPAPAPVASAVAEARARLARLE